MTTPPLRAAALAAALFALPSVHADAQIRGSERASVSQTVDGTTLTLDYARPSARGRALFGHLVPWNVVWTPGANWATTLTVDRDVRLGGVPVPAGDYSVWMIPREGAWTLTLNPEPRIFHFQKPDSADGQIHVAVRPERAHHMEMLTWSFPAVSGDGALLAMHWGDTRVSVDVVVQPTKPAAVAPEDRALYVGRYDLSIMDGIGYPTAAFLEVAEEEGRLRARMPFPIHPGDELEFDLVPAGTHRFSPGLYHGDQLFNVEMGVSFEFDVQGGRARAVTMRGIEGTAFGTGATAADATGSGAPSLRR
ncbi:MAG: hypothetical protein AMXMBFR53_33740 [Gemmatimonadota bacterium]